MSCEWSTQRTVSTLARLRAKPALVISASKSL
eukprot:CAMPEP_0175756680 /NCGR_PEP_ID=MMETSP0097-20121207/64067_1 /TAXON_ID=311494 /ORGANISM="Alexandrium monilatum, Strain CCMP3105" /LENGTH=31 /DNA_ID= /DNA_START= /DNA_END= /DNA_ORIENTATION=